MRVNGILFLFSALCCASPASIGGMRQSTAQVVTAAGTIATLSVIAQSDQVVDPLAASPGGAWAQLSPTYAEVGIPLTLFLPETRIAGNQGLNVRRTLGGVALRNYLLCGDDGTGPNADTYLISMNIATQIQAEADGTSKVATVMDATATSMTTGTNIIRCSTTGQLEKRINDVLAKRLNLK